MRKQFKANSDGGDSNSKKCSEGYGAASGGFWLILRLAGMWSQAVYFVVACLTKIWLQ
jgi:hypothetical protein